MSQELEQAKSTMARLVLWRKRELDRAEEIIANANREFDEVAIPLGQTINELEKREASSTSRTSPNKKRSSKQRAPSFAGLTNEQRAMYEQLLKKGN